MNSIIRSTEAAFAALFQPMSRDETVKAIQEAERMKREWDAVMSDEGGEVPEEEGK